MCGLFAGNALHFKAFYGSSPPFSLCREVSLLKESALQCVAVCCSVLQCVAVCCSVLLLCREVSSFNSLLWRLFRKRYPNSHFALGGTPSAHTGTGTWYRVATIISFAKEPCKRDNILQRSPIILRSLEIVANPYKVAKTHGMPYLYGWFSA